MLRSALALTLAAAALAPLLPRTSRGAVERRPEDAIARQPVLLVDTTGSTLLGLVHRHLCLYGDGHGFAVENGQAQVFTMSKAELQRVLARLADLGAFELADQQPTIVDVPLTTVTAFFDAPDARAHTFSFWGGGAYGPIAGVIETLFRMGER